MTDSSARPSLLEELDARQNDVLQQLDDLNLRIERLLHEHGARLKAVPDLEASPPLERDSTHHFTDRAGDRAA
jgi:hypothetical protein